MIKTKTNAAAPSLVSQTLKVDIVVHGRFIAFGLAGGLLGLGHDVVVHTNYPSRIVERFGVPASKVRTFVWHGILSRIGNRVRRYLDKNALDSMLHRSFGRWAARSVRPDADVVYGFSGVMEEFLRRPRGQPRQLRAVVRGSTHIREQTRILKEEETRVGTRLDLPSDWIAAREEREYALADMIIVLSTFSHDSFLSQGIESSRVNIIPPGVDLSRFHAKEALLAERKVRLLTRAPLRVLTVGTFSYRKGARDIIDVASTLSKKMEFRFVGDRPPETAKLVAENSQIIQFIHRVPEESLMQHYAWADVFFFPTIEDGFAAVLLQAAATGLPVIVTRNCSAPDFIVEGETGWIHPIRDTNGFIQRLSWCDENREIVARMARAASQAIHTRDWQSMAAEFVSICRAQGVQYQDTAA